MASVSEEVIEVAGYRLAERIGTGGMGEVYKAYNHSLNRYAAVKILYQASQADRFKNEAYIQSSINHPNIAHLYEYVLTANRHCIVMEYVEGETLDMLLHRKRKLPNETIEEIVRQVVTTLVYLHKKNIIHRDIKPSNFKIQPDGTVKMLDFGIAKHKYSPRFTQVGFIVGTTQYLAPEQFLQEPVLKSDVWALAVMTYELATGYTPFEAGNPVTIQAKIRSGQFTDPTILIPQLSRKLCLVIEKGLKVNPANRGSAAAIANLFSKDTKDKSLPFTFESFSLPKHWLPALVVAVIIVSIWALYPSTDSIPLPPLPQQQLLVPATATRVAATHTMIINTPGIANSTILLQDGTSKHLPFTVSGKEGEQFRFTLHAEGYVDKKVEVVLTPRRISYEFNLDKK